VRGPRPLTEDDSVRSLPSVVVLANEPDERGDLRSLRSSGRAARGPFHGRGATL